MGGNLSATCVGFYRYVLWFDLEQMKGNLMDAMSDAVGNRLAARMALAFIIFIYHGLIQNVWEK